MPVKPNTFARRKASQKGRRTELLERPFPEARVFGYARVSTEDQNLDMQLAALRDAGVRAEDMFVEKVSAVSAKRPQFHLLMKSIEAGDQLVVHSLSRLGRDVPQIHGIIGELERMGVAWRSFTEPHLTTETAVGRLMLNVTGAMAQFERDQIIERTKRGMAERKRQGMWIGRRRMVTPKIAAAMRAMRRRKVEPAAIIRHVHARFGVKVKLSTFYAYTKKPKRAES